MLNRLVTLFLLFSGFTALPGATYYISPTGSDSSPGTLSQPWATYSNAVQVVAAGDTVLVQPGIYPNAGNINYPYSGGECVFTTSGTSNAPITFRAMGPVTNQFTFEVRAPYYYFDGFTWDGVGGIYVTTSRGGSRPGPGSGYVTMTNCTVQNTLNQGAFALDPPDGTFLPETAPGHCTVINCLFNHMTNSGTINLEGVGNLVQGCTFANGISQDSVYLFGSNSVVRLCTFTNMAGGLENSGFGNHPDIMQCFGQNGVWTAAMLFERNYVVNCPIQLTQFETTEPGGVNQSTITNAALWGVTIRNNVFEDSGMQCSIDIPNVKFYNNTFRRCSNGGTLLDFAFYDPGWTMFRGAAWGGAVVNNAFIDCSGAYSAAAYGPSQGNLTNSTAQIKGHASICIGSGVVNVWGVYTNLTGTITGGTLYCASGDLYTVDPTNFAGGTFNVALPFTDPANGFSADVQWGAYNAGRMLFRLNTTAVPSGEVKAVLAPYVP